MKTNKQFIKDCMSAGLRVKPVQPYQGYSVKIKFKCMDCNSIFTRSPNLMFKRPKCPVCSAQERASKTADTRNAQGQIKLLAHLKTTSMALVPGTFVSNSQHAKFKCSCGNIWNAYPKSLMGLKHGCKRCSQVASGNAQFVDTWKDTKLQLKSRGAKILSVEPNKSTDLITYSCPIHNEVITNTVLTVRNRLKISTAAATGCTKCAQALYAKSSYNRMEYTRKRGDTISLMGYEPKAVEWLATKGINVKSLLVCKDEDFEIIYYKDSTGKTRKYIPDFYVKDTDFCIEVKSLYTAGLAIRMEAEQTGMGIRQDILFNTLVRKSKAASAKGYDFKLLVFGERGKVKLPIRWNTYTRTGLLRWIRDCKENIGRL